MNHTAREIIHLAELTQPRGWVLPDRYRKTDYTDLVARCAPPTPLKVIQVAAERPAGDVLWTATWPQRRRPPSRGPALEAARPHPGDVCQIPPSGGTTGLPKGCPAPTTTFCATWSTRPRPALQRGRHPLVATTVHNWPLLVGVTACVFFGAKQVLLDSTRPADFLAAVQKERCTRTALVPHAGVAHLVLRGVDRYDVSRLTRSTWGGQLTAELVRAAEENWACCMRTPLAWWRALRETRPPTICTRAPQPSAGRCAPTTPSPP